MSPADAKIVILGLTFKENCPDVRNTRVTDIISKLKEYGITPTVVDPWADKELVRRIYGIELAERQDIKDADCIIHAVAHREFKEDGLAAIMAMFKPDNGNKNVLIDVKGSWPVAELDKAGVSWWRM